MKQVKIKIKKNITFKMILMKSLEEKKNMKKKALNIQNKTRFIVDLFFSFLLFWCLE